LISTPSPSVPELRPDAPQGGRMAVVALMAAGLFGIGRLLAPPGFLATALMAAGGTLGAVLLVSLLRNRFRAHVRGLARAMLDRVIARDAVPSFVVDEEGAVLTRNAAAETRFPAQGEQTLAGLLKGLIANPAALLYRLQGKARRDGAAREEIATRGGHLVLAVHQLGEDSFLWRLEEAAARMRAGRTPDSLPVAMLTVGRGNTVLFMNEAARHLAGGRVKALDRLFPELPLRPGEINTVSTAEGPVDVVVAQRDNSGGRQEIYMIEVGRGAPGPDLAFDSLPVPMLTLDPDGRILTANRLATRLLGRAPDAGCTLSDVMTGLGRTVPDWLREMADGERDQQSEFLRLRRTDREVFVQVTLSRMQAGDGTRLIAVLNDATELKTLEAQFVQGQKMQAIGQLAGGVAHDFNNLLTAISGHCDLLLLRHDQGDPDYGDLVQINQNANRAAALVGQLLAFSRKQTLRPEILDLRDTLADLTHLLNRLVGEKVTLTLSHDPVLRPIRADKRQLEQVLMNLVVNARDAMPEGGEIRIETEVAHLDTPLERDRATVPVGDYVTVRVRDSGIGIAPDKIQKVFEPFFTTKRTGEGTGLGLSTAYGIVKQHGGFIFVDSAPGSGTCFTLYFPAHDTVPEAPAMAAVEAPQILAQNGEGVVLLVEDEAPVRAFASRALRLRGYTVLEAESAEDALRTLEESDLTVDVFVTDVVMPGMDGPTWVRQALKERPDVRVVFVSGYAEGAFSGGEPMVPNSVFLPKPFSLNQLTATVQQQMH